MPTIVLDASAAVELLLRTPAGERVAEALTGPALAAPAHIDGEVLSALGRLVRAGEVDEGDVPPMLDALARAPLVRYPLAALLVVAWELRENLTLRDALYVALARRLGATLLTADARLARAPRLGCPLLVV